MAESRFRIISNAGEMLPANTLEDALGALREGKFVWLDYYRPERDELAALVEPLGIHPLSIEDCIDLEEVPKIEDFQRNTFVIVNSFQYVNQELAVDEVDLFIGANYLITVSGVNDNGRRPLQDIARIVSKNIETVRQGPAFLMHSILDFIVDNKFKAIVTVEDELDNAEELILANPGGFDATALLRLRRDLLTLRKSLFHEREILVKICRKDCVFIPDKAIYSFRDVSDHLVRFFELTESYRDIVTSLMEMYLSMLNNQMAKVANQTNMTVRRLTFITTIFMPLSLLAGIGGMSEWSMMTGPENWRIAYPAFLVAMAVIGIVNYYLLKWLERRDAG